MQRPKFNYNSHEPERVSGPHGPVAPQSTPLIYGPDGAVPFTEFDGLIVDYPQYISNIALSTSPLYRLVLSGCKFERCTLFNTGIMDRLVYLRVPVGRVQFALNKATRGEIIYDIHLPVEIHAWVMGGRYFYFSNMIDFYQFLRVPHVQPHAYSRM
jgi:hypothetical protein